MQGCWILMADADAEARMLNANVCRWSRCWCWLSVFFLLQNTGDSMAKHRHWRTNTKDVFAFGHSSMFCLFTQSRLLAAVPAEFATQVDDEHLESCRDTDSTTFHISSFRSYISLSTTFHVSSFHSYISLSTTFPLLFLMFLFCYITQSTHTCAHTCWDMSRLYKDKMTKHEKTKGHKDNNTKRQIDNMKHHTNIICLVFFHIFLVFLSICSSVSTLLTFKCSLIMSFDIFLNNIHT